MLEKFNPYTKICTGRAIMGSATYIPNTVIWLLVSTSLFLISMITVKSIFKNAGTIVSPYNGERI